MLLRMNSATNNSYSMFYLVCAVALARDVGVDVEDIERPGETGEIADQFFSPNLMAAAIRRGADPNLSITVKNTVPLVF